MNRELLDYYTKRVAEEVKDNDSQNVTKEQLGLDKVDNTPDDEKKVAYASKAEKDNQGNVIHETYAKKEEIASNVSVISYIDNDVLVVMYGGNDI